MSARVEHAIHHDPMRLHAHAAVPSHRHTPRHDIVVIERVDTVLIEPLSCPNDDAVCQTAASHQAGRPCTGGTPGFGDRQEDQEIVEIPHPRVPTVPFITNLGSLIDLVM